MVTSYKIGSIFPLFIWYM